LPPTTTLARCAFLCRSVLTRDSRSVLPSLLQLALLPTRTASAWGLVVLTELVGEPLLLPLGDRERVVAVRTLDVDIRHVNLLAAHP
jgi:hypothetical protein